MLSYDALCRHPDAFPNLTGLTRSGFDTLVAEFEAAERDRRASARATRRDSRPLRNAPRSVRGMGRWSGWWRSW
jgi:hypothetical protein